MTNPADDMATSQNSDILTPAERSERMARVRGKNTRPELIVRRLIHGLGYRYRLHRADLPGRPDLVFPSRRKVVFVHGCFWHRHPGCRLATMPRSRASFWQSKFEANVERDRRNIRDLETLGWTALIVWQCQTKQRDSLSRRVRRFLDGGQDIIEIQEAA